MYIHVYLSVGCVHTCRCVHTKILNRLVLISSCVISYTFITIKRVYRVFWSTLCQYYQYRRLVLWVFFSFMYRSPTEYLFLFHILCAHIQRRLYTSQTWSSEYILKTKDGICTVDSSHHIHTMQPDEQRTYRFTYYNTYI